MNRAYYRSTQSGVGIYIGYHRSQRQCAINDAVRLNRTDAALVGVIAPIPPNLEDGEARAERDAAQFVKVLFPRLTDYLPV